MKADVILDAKGLSCPMPIIKLNKKMKELESGQVLELLSTDPGSEEDVPAWCDQKGEEFLSYDEDDDGVYHFFIKKT